MHDDKKNQIENIRAEKSTVEKVQGGGIKGKKERDNARSKA